jgi:hypothetical protein
MSASIGSVGKAMARPWSCRGRGRHRPGRVAGVTGVAVGLAVALAACTPAQPSSSAAAGVYASVQVYTPGGVGASLPDYLIAPQPGSLNPWQQQAAPGGRFTVTIRSDPAPGQANTLPMAAGTTSQHTGYLIYRVYLPAGALPRMCRFQC